MLLCVAFGRGLKRKRVCTDSPGCEQSGTFPFLNRAHTPVMLSLILLVFALVLFVIAGFVNPAEPWRGRLLCFGLACLAGAELAGRVPVLR
jgi:hypothetical protein